MKKRIFAAVLTFIFCLSLLVGCGSRGITAQKAEQIALDYAGISKSQVTDIHNHIIEQEGIACIQIHITTEDGSSTTVVINAATGEVIGNG